jgi:hypothetical protein
MRRVCRTDAEELASKEAEDDRPLPSQRMHLHHGVLGLVDRRLKDGLAVLQLPGRGVGMGVVVAVAAQRPQLIGEAAQLRRQRRPYFRLRKANLRSSTATVMWFGADRRARRRVD